MSGKEATFSHHNMEGEKNMAIAIHILILRAYNDMTSLPIGEIGGMGLVSGEKHNCLKVLSLVFRVEHSTLITTIQKYIFRFVFQSHLIPL